MCKDHLVIYDDYDSYQGERMYCFDCAKKKGQHKKEGCFIATAAYGTPFCAELDLLRAFRDQNMKRTALGRYGIRLYYLLSPPIAWVVGRSSLLRFAVRRALSPVVKRLRKR